MSYEFERLVVDQRNPSDVTVVFRKPPEKEFGVEWPASRFEMPASDINSDAPIFTKLVKKTSPDAVNASIEALRLYFSRSGSMPDYLMHKPAPPSGVVIPFVRRVA